MNEKMKELLKQSGLQPYYDAQEGHIEKFAESIVEECISVIQNRDMGGGDSSDIEIRYCIFDLKNHFGIEDE